MVNVPTGYNHRLTQCATPWSVDDLNDWIAIHPLTGETLDRAVLAVVSNQDDQDALEAIMQANLPSVDACTFNHDYGCQREVGIGDYGENEAPIPARRHLVEDYYPWTDFDEFQAYIGLRYYSISNRTGWFWYNPGFAISPSSDTKIVRLDIGTRISALL